MRWQQSKTGRRHETKKSRKSGNLHLIDDDQNSCWLIFCFLVLNMNVNDQQSISIATCLPDSLPAHISDFNKQFSPQQLLFSQQEVTFREIRRLWNRNRVETFYWTFPSRDNRPPPSPAELHVGPRAGKPPHCSHAALHFSFQKPFSTTSPGLTGSSLWEHRCPHKVTCWGYRCSLPVGQDTILSAVWRTSHKKIKGFKL